MAFRIARQYERTVPLTFSGNYRFLYLRVIHPEYTRPPPERPTVLLQFGFCCAICAPFNMTNPRCIAMTSLMAKAREHFKLFGVQTERELSRNKNFSSASWKTEIRLLKGDRGSGKKKNKYPRRAGSNLFQRLPEIEYPLRKAGYPWNLIQINGSHPGIYTASLSRKICKALLLPSLFELIRIEGFSIQGPAQIHR